MTLLYGFIIVTMLGFVYLFYRDRVRARELKRLIAPHKCFEDWLAELKCQLGEVTGEDVD